MNEQHEGPGGGMIVYRTEDGLNRILVRLEDETVWLTQAMMADLFQTSPQNITLHIKAIYQDEELSEGATCKKYLQVQTEGTRTVQRRLRHYNLDMIIAVGYRVRSPRGAMFRQWATERLREYLIKGFTLDDDRLKGRDRLADYFDELLARIREIRASEARVYQRIREIFALASDYIEDEQETKTFFATVQNKMHFAAAGMTAAEIVHTRANAERPNMGLTSWTGSRVLKRDAETAKNYLDAKEIDTLNRIVVMFLDQAEFRAQRRQDIRMRDWEMFLDKFLRDTDLPVLPDAGSVTREQALLWAHEQYRVFAERRQLQAEAEADARYLEDLRTSAKVVEARRMRKTPDKEEPKAKQNKRKESEPMSERKSVRSLSAERVLIYELKVTIPNLPVWRRILVRGDVNLGLLHTVIQVAMGWTNSHLHQFTVGKKRYSAPDTHDGIGFGEPDLNEEETLLIEVAPRAKTKFAYEYDFGDSWEHCIAVEKIHELDTAPKCVAECLDGACACPPEDCGGVGGYADLLEIIKDPNHEEHESMMEWLGGEFDPNEFDIQKINKYLKKLKFPRMTWQQLARVLMDRDGYRE